MADDTSQNEAAAPEAVALAARAYGDALSGKRPLEAAEQRLLDAVATLIGKSVIATPADQASDSPDNDD